MNLAIFFHIVYATLGWTLALPYLMLGGQKDKYVMAYGKNEQIKKYRDFKAELRGAVEDMKQHPEKNW